MEGVQSTKDGISTGIEDLDSLIGKLSSGDNVIWYDRQGHLAWPFAFSFLQSSLSRRVPVFYFTFDIAPKDLLVKLGTLGNAPLLTIVDCYSEGNGMDSETDSSRRSASDKAYPGRIMRLERPIDKDVVLSTLSEVYMLGTSKVSLIFDSLTGMQELWGNEDAVLDFYSNTCPKLYGLGIVSYWIVKRDLPSSSVRGQLNRMAQRVLDVAVARGRTSLMTTKGGTRGTAIRRRRYKFWVTDDNDLEFEEQAKPANKIEVGQRVREARVMKGMSQRQLARLVHVSDSTISQIEGNMVLPSLATLLKVAKTLSVEAGFFFEGKRRSEEKLVFSSSEGREIDIRHLPDRSLTVKAISSSGSDRKTEIYVVEIPPQGKVGTHFLLHKGEEIGLLLNGRLQFVVNQQVHRVNSGDIVYLGSHVPDQWENPGPTPARLLWIKVN
ncbi:cupin domain-containing protein [Thermodesulfobacteriota bacterium]